MKLPSVPTAALSWIFPGGICPTRAGFGMSIWNWSERGEKCMEFQEKGGNGGGLWDPEVGRGSC